MYGTPTHRRFETLPEPVDLAGTVTTQEAGPPPGPWVGRDTPLDQALDEAIRFPG